MRMYGVLRECISLNRVVSSVCVYTMLLEAKAKTAREAEETDASDESESESSEDESGRAVNKRPAGKIKGVKGKFKKLKADKFGESRIGQGRDKLKSTWLKHHKDEYAPTIKELFSKNEESVGGRQKNTDLINSLVCRMPDGKYKIDDRNAFVQDVLLYTSDVFVFSRIQHNICNVTLCVACAIIN